MNNAGGLGGNHTLVTAAAIAIDHDIRGINLDSNSGTFQVFRNTTIGSVVNPGANGGLGIEFKGANSNVTLSGLSGNIPAIPANDSEGIRVVVAPPLNSTISSAQRTTNSSA